VKNGTPIAWALKNIFLWESKQNSFQKTCTFAYKQVFSLIP
jgi:hypothetical protein